VMPTALSQKHARSHAATRHESPCAASRGTGAAIAAAGRADAAAGNSLLGMSAA